MAQALCEPKKIESWGRIPKAQHVEHWYSSSSDDLPALRPQQTFLPFGMGRSYGDSCLNHKHAALRTTRANKYIQFDESTGELTAEAGATLSDILQDFVPRGWFLPTTPGTKFVTLGGAIANDVHGKNHHSAGTFGCHVVEFELLRSTGERLVCSPTQHAHLFAATIGGLGLTGLITRATIKLRKVAGPFINQKVVKYKNISHFFELSEQFEHNYEHSVSWVDCTSTGAALGRGLFMCGNHSNRTLLKAASKKPLLTIPIDFPSCTLNSFTVKAFNALYYGKQFAHTIENTVHYDPFFYPLDVVHAWNRIYGPKGFYQWQCVVPYEGLQSPISDILANIARSGNASFLAVLKTFGNKSSPGLLSFPQKGVTLALDFRNMGNSTLRLFEDLDTIVRTNGGRIYPAKDGRMSPETFQSGYSQWRDFVKFVDPVFSSSLARRLGLCS